MQAARKRKIRVGLPDDRVAVDHDVFEIVHRDARRQDADHALHGVWMIAVADVQVVVNVVLRNAKVARGVIDPVVAKMIDLVARE